MVYFLLAAFVIPFVGYLVGNLIIEFWDDIVRQIKIIGNCLGQLLATIIGIVIIMLILGWLFKSCPSPDPDSGTYDYDPGLRYRKY